MSHFSVIPLFNQKQKQTEANMRLNFESLRNFVCFRDKNKITEYCFLF